MSDDGERTPKVRTSHHRNKDEAARLQALVDKRLKADAMSDEATRQETDARLAADAMSERWCPVVGYEGSYEVSDQGRVRSVTRRGLQRARSGTLYLKSFGGRLLRPGATSTGHLTVVLGRKNTRTVHSLVIEAFVGPRPAGLEVRHIDGDEANNVLGNLEYATRTRNSQDKKWHRGAKSYVLRPDQIVQIKKRIRTWTRGLAPTLAREFGVSDSTIYAIKYGVFHKDIPA